MALGLLLGASAVSSLAAARSESKRAQAQADASDRSAKMQLQATRETNQLQRDMFNRSNELSEPFRQSGLRAQNRLADVFGLDGSANDYNAFYDNMGARFYRDPGYQFAMGEGMDALNNSAAARGLRLSGAAMKDAQRFGQGLAAQQYGDFYNRESSRYGNYLNALSGMAGTGQNIAVTQGNAGMNTANSIGNALMAGTANAGQAIANAGQARASGYSGINNALQGGIGNSIQAWMMNQVMNPGSTNALMGGLM